MPENGLSISEIADLLEEAPSRIRYLISRDRIKCCRLVGQSRLYDEKAIERVRDALYNMRVQRTR